MNNMKTTNGGNYALDSESRKMIIENLSMMIEQLNDYRLQVVSGFVKRIAEGVEGHD